MSRCFPFPPPGYIRNNSDALINSIKLREEKEKAKKDRKEKKREKKERKKEKKERKLQEASVAAEKLKLIADGKLQKDIDNELLERSGITEEHDQPVSSHQEPCLSDSSQSSKRKREADHGPAIKIRLPLRKHREPEEPKSEYQVGSSSARVGNADSFTQLASASDHRLQSISNNENNQLPGNSESGHGKRLQSLVPGDTPVSNIILDDKSRREFSLYDSLLQIPQVTYDGYDSADEAWLFRSEPTEAKPISKKLKYDSEAALRCSSSMWPRAQHLPEVGIYALPYTVPF